MEFEFWRSVTSIVHYILFVVGFFSIIFYGAFNGKYTIRKFVIRFYVLFLTWVLITYLSNGCPITLLENYISNKVFGKPFYPFYDFSDTDVMMLLIEPKTYMLLGILLSMNVLDFLIKKFNKGDNI